MKRAGPVPALREGAAKLASLIPRRRLHPAVVAWADAQNRRGRWGVGFSGGADSLALLLVLWAHWPERRPRLKALHFAHRLRGAASAEEVRFCRKVCRALGVEFVTEAWRRPGRKSREQPSEAEARTARLAFFRRHARVLWLGHQLDDVAETMLMRLARGSGSGGLAAPRPVQVIDGRVNLRPLLLLKKAELIAGLRECGIEWRDDASNSTPVYFRNRIRSEVLPPWQAAAQRDALAGAGRARMLLEEDDDALEWAVDQLAPVGGDRALAIDVLRGQPRAITRRALHRWLLAQREKLEISSQAFDALLGAVERGEPTRHSLGVGLFGVIRAGRLRLARIARTHRNFHRRLN